MTPRYFTSDWWKWHFSGLRKRSCCYNLVRNCQTFSSWNLSLSSVAMIMSSMYTLSHSYVISSWKIMSIMIWNVTGKFVSPKNITVGSNNPSLILKAAFHSSPSLIQMLLYPHLTSNFKKMHFLASSWINSEMSGSGYLLKIAHLLRQW